MASLFCSVCTALRQNDELCKHVEGESGLFKSADKTWMGRVDASRLWAEALVEEVLSSRGVAVRK